MPLNVFISYSHKDRKLRDELAIHLSKLRNQQAITDWFDGDIIGGTEWEPQILERLHAAQIILLLISANFLASKFCYSIEMTQAIARHDANQACVIPIILRPVDWKGTPFAKLKVLPSDGKPVSQWRSHDEAFANIIKGIRRAIEDWNARASPKPVVSPSAAGTSLVDGTQVPLWNLPFRRNPFFTGRDSFLTQLHTILHTQQTAFVSQPVALTGLGGIGKTQIALEYAYRYSDEYQYILWVRANTHETLTTDFVTLAHLFNLPEQDVQDQTRTVEAVRQWLARHTGWLLIMDNADDLSLVDAFLPTRHSGHILFTTRTQVMSGRALRVDIDKMETEEGRRFLLCRTGILAPDAPLASVPEALRTVATTIVYALDGLPLALDQAGAYIDETGCNLSHYLELYQTQRRALHARGSKRPSDHPEPVATTWLLSFQNIEQANPAATELLRCCAFLHPDAIPEELVIEGASYLSPVLQTIADNSMKFDEAISELLNYSLVRRLAETRSLSMHRLVQAVLKDEMDQSSQKRWAEQIVQVVNHLFPFGEPTPWYLCQRYSPHAILCSDYIRQWNLATFEAGHLLTNTASYLYDRAQYREAEPLFQQALSIREHALDPDHPDTGYTLNNLAMLYRMQAKYEQAEALLQRALAIREKVLGPEHPDTTHSLNNLSWIYYNQGKYEQAEPLMKRALAISEQVPEHPNFAASLNNLAWLYHAQGQYEQAEALYLRTLAVREKILGPEHPETATSLNNLAELYQTQHQFDRAEPLYKRAYTIVEQVLGPDHPIVATTLNNLARLYQSQGQYEQAEALMQRALAVREKMLGPEHPQTAISLYNLARLYFTLDQCEKAEPLMQHALAIREKILGLEHPYTANVLKSYADLLQKMKRTEEAATFRERAKLIRARLSS